MDPGDDTPEPLAERLQQRAAGIEEIPGVINPWRAETEHPEHGVRLIVGMIESEPTGGRAAAASNPKLIPGPGTRYSPIDELLQMPSSARPTHLHGSVRLTESGTPERGSSPQPGSPLDAPTDSRAHPNMSVYRAALAAAVAGATCAVGCLLATVAIIRTALRPNPYIALALAMGGLVLVLSTAIGLRNRRHK